MTTSTSIEIGAGDEPGTFKVQVLHSVGGMPRGQVTLDADEIMNQCDDLERAVLASAAPRRGALSAAERPVQAVG